MPLSAPVSRRIDRARVPWIIKVRGGQGQDVLDSTGKDLLPVLFYSPAKPTDAWLRCLHPYLRVIATTEIRIHPVHALKASLTPLLPHINNGSLRNAEEIGEASPMRVNRIELRFGTRNTILPARWIAEVIACVFAGRLVDQSLLVLLLGLRLCSTVLG